MTEPIDLDRLAEALYLLGIEDTDQEGSHEIAATIAAEYDRLTPSEKALGEQRERPGEPR